MIEDPSLGLDMKGVGGFTSILPTCYGISKFASGVLGANTSPTYLLAGINDLILILRSWNPWHKWIVSFFPISHSPEQHCVLLGSKAQKQQCPGSTFVPKSIDAVGMILLQVDLQPPR